MEDRNINRALRGINLVHEKATRNSPISKEHKKQIWWKFLKYFYQILHKMEPEEYPIARQKNKKEYYVASRFYRSAK